MGKSLVRFFWDTVYTETRDNAHNSQAQGLNLSLDLLAYLLTWVNESCQNVSYQKRIRIYAVQFSYDPLGDSFSDFGGQNRLYHSLQVSVAEWLARLTAVWEDPGSNHVADSCVYRDSCCDIQSWARAVHLYCSA